MLKVTVTVQGLESTGKYHQASERVKEVDSQDQAAARVARVADKAGFTGDPPVTAH